MDNTISSSPCYSKAIINADLSSSRANHSTQAESQSPLQQQSDTVTLSPQSISKNRANDTEETSNNSSNKSVKNDTTFSSEELQKIQKLQQRDAEVKAHEQAHLSAAGQYAAGGASFSYETGPNGKRYATGGEVPINLSKEKDPEATLAKMIQVRRAALAPANPSSADRNIAARASMLAAQAMSEMNKNDNNEESSSVGFQKDSSVQDTSSSISADNKIAGHSDNSIPSYTRSKALLAYAAQS